MALIEEFLKKNRGSSSVGRALALQARGHRFETGELQKADMVELVDTMGLGSIAHKA